MSKAERLDSITEATASLVDVIDNLQNTAGDENNNDSNQYSDNFTFNYKDLILYALGGKLK